MPILAALLPVLTFACGGAPDYDHVYRLHQTIEIDADFAADPYELAQVNAALDDWESNTPASFVRVLVPHAQLIVDGNSPDTVDTTILFRQTMHEDVNCPTGAMGPLESQYVAQTFRYPARSLSVICLDETIALARDGEEPGISEYRSTVEHEIGHALGMEHRDPADGGAVLMFHANGPHQADHVTCGDLVQFSAFWKTPLPAGCQ